MPYKISGNCVQKLDGTVVKCHDTADQATAHMRALMLNVPEAKEKRLREKAITDAPNLRADDFQECGNCKYFQLVKGTGSEMMDADGVGICTQFEFQTNADFVCDAWETVLVDTVPASMDDTGDVAMMEAETFAVQKEADGYRWVLSSSSAYQDREGEIVSQAALERDAERMTASGNYGTLDWYHMFKHNGAWVAGKELTPAQILEAVPLRLGNCDFSAMHGRMAIESGLFDDADVGAMFASHAKEYGVSRSFFHAAGEPDANKIYHDIRTFSRSLLPRGKESNLLTMLFGNKEKNNMEKDRQADLVKKLGAAKVTEVLAAAEQGQTVAELAGVKHAETATADAPAAPEQPAWFVSDMTPEKFNELVEASVAKTVTPLVEALGTKIAELDMAQAATIKEANGMLAKEIAESKALAAALDVRLKEIEGLKPRAYRATQDPTTITDPAKLKEATPQADKSLAGWFAT